VTMPTRTAKPSRNSCPFPVGFALFTRHARTSNVRTSQVGQGARTAIARSTALAMPANYAHGDARSALRRWRAVLSSLLSVAWQGFRRNESMLERSTSVRSPIRRATSSPRITRRRMVLSLTLSTPATCSKVRSIGASGDQPILSFSAMHLLFGQRGLHDMRDGRGNSAVVSCGAFVQRFDENRFQSKSNWQRHASETFFDWLGRSRSRHISSIK
jgi:hypothetical protein